jgi:hypothetical protein
MPTLPVGTMNEHALAWHPDGRRLAVGGSTRASDLGRRRNASRSLRVMQQVTYLGFHPDGSLLMSNGWMQSTACGNRRLGRCCSFPTDSIVFSTDGRWVGAFATRDGGQLEGARARNIARRPQPRRGTGRVFMAAPARIPPWRWEWKTACAFGKSPAVAKRPSRSAALPRFFQPDGRELMTCGDTGLHRWPIPEHRLRPAVPVGFAPKMTLPFRSRPLEPGWPLIAVTSDEAGVAVVPACRDHGATPLLAPAPRIRRAEPDGKWLATSGWHSPLLRCGMCARGKWPTNGNRDRSPPVSRPTAASWFDADGRVRLLSVETFELVHRLRDASAYPTQAAFLGRKSCRRGSDARRDPVTNSRRAALWPSSPTLFGDRATWMSFTPDGSSRHRRGLLEGHPRLGSAPHLHAAEAMGWIGITGVSGGRVACRGVSNWS